MSILLNIHIPDRCRKGSPIRWPLAPHAAAIVDIHRRPIHLSATPMTYEYVCEVCGHQWEAEQSIKDRPLKKCVSCGEERAKRLVSGGTGFLLKGGGWYADLYGSPGAGAKNGTDDKAAKANATTEKSEGGEAKPSTVEAKPSTTEKSGSNGSAAGSTTSTSAPATKPPATSAAKAG
jgi:putative FmdB family regulatory protein